MLRGWIRKFLFGFDNLREYVPVDAREFDGQVAVVVSSQSGETFNVTKNHLLLGYKPMLFSIFGDTSALPHWILTEKKICLQFIHGSQNLKSRWRDFNTTSPALALIEAVQIDVRHFDNIAHLGYQGVFAKQNLLPDFNKTMVALYQKLKRQASNNVNLPGNLTQQVSSMYTVPRIISVISISDGKNFNMMPTDLHGAISANTYVDSLRITGKANQQVTEFKRIAKTDIDPDQLEKIYALGKNHMRDMRPLDQFEYSGFSREWKLPLPVGAVRYQELIQTDYIDIGIHRIHFFQIVNREIVNEQGATLATVHRHYVVWRKNHGLV